MRSERAKFGSLSTSPPNAITPNLLSFRRASAAKQEESASQGPNLLNSLPQQQRLPVRARSTFPHPDVTSDLDAKNQRADHRQGGGGAIGNRERGANSFVVKILTSKPLGLKILQTIFAKPAPVAAFRGVGAGGYPEICYFLPPCLRVSEPFGTARRNFFLRVSLQ